MEHTHSRFSAALAGYDEWVDPEGCADHSFTIVAQRGHIGFVRAIWRFTSPNPPVPPPPQPLALGSFAHFAGQSLRQPSDPLEESADCAGSGAWVDLAESLALVGAPARRIGFVRAFLGSTSRTPPVPPSLEPLALGSFAHFPGRSPRLLFEHPESLSDAQDGKLRLHMPVTRYQRPLGVGRIGFVRAHLGSRCPLPATRWPPEHRYWVRSPPFQVPRPPFLP